MNKPLNQAQVGDEICVIKMSSHYGSFHYCVLGVTKEKIEKVTSSTIKVPFGTFNIKNGDLRGSSSYNNTHIAFKTDEWVEETNRQIQERKNRQAYLNSIKNTNFPDMTTEQLKQVSDLIQSFQGVK